MSRYSAFARYYDSLTANIDYAKRAEYFNKIIAKSCQSGGKILLDLACGTGKLSREFARLGYDVIGTDNSYEMLSAAMAHSDEYPSIQYLLQPMQNLDMYGTIDVCVCALDSINHITDIDILARCFSRVSLFLEPKGVFIFDVNTQYKHEKVLGDNCFIYDCEDVYCGWQNTYDKAKKTTEICLDFFAKEEDGSYTRSGETFYERMYTPEELEKLIADAGMYIADVFAGDSFDKVNEQTQRAVYVVKKEVKRRN